MRRVFTVSGLALSVLMASGCAATMTAASHVRPGLSMAQYRTYDWGPSDELPSGDPRLDADALFTDQVQGAVEKALATRGISLSSREAPDLLVHFHANIDTRIDVNATEREHGHCQVSDCQSWVVEYEAGTLLLDVVDARTNQLVWRGWAQGSLDGVLTDREKMKEKVGDAIARIMVRFPKR